MWHAHPVDEATDLRANRRCFLDPPRQTRRRVPASRRFGVGGQDTCQDRRVRIGTWNLEGKWSSDHLSLLEQPQCDVWLLTEVPAAASIPGMAAHRTTQAMGPRKTWAGIFSRADTISEPDPHPATAMALCDGLRLMSSVLPWRSCGASWEGQTLGEKMSRTLSALEAHIGATTVWGGDWNQALEGRDYVGSSVGRTEILRIVANSHLSVPTATLSSASKGQRSIDHIAVPISWDVNGAHRLEAAVSGRRLSDHDAYVVVINR